jgi:membrane protein
MGDAGERLKRATGRLAGAFSRLHGEARPDPSAAPEDAGGPPDPDARPEGAGGAPEPAPDFTDAVGAPDLAPRAGGGALRGFIGLVTLPWALFRKTFEDGLTGLAAESAFFAALSLFPGLLVLAAALGWLDLIAGQEVARRSQAAAVEFLGQVLTEQGSGVVRAVRDLFARHRGGVLTSALLLGIWALSRGFTPVIRALDVTYGLRERRSWLNLHLTAVLLSAGSALVASVLLAMVAVGPFLGHDRALAASLGIRKAFALTWDWARSPLVFVLVVFWTATLYHLAPNRRASWKSDLPGAVFAAALWLLISLGFGTYLHMTARYNQIFGALAGGMILMIWLYLLCLSLLLGGALNAILQQRAGIARR